MGLWHLDEPATIWQWVAVLALVICLAGGLIIFVCETWPHGNPLY